MCGVDLVVVEVDSHYGESDEKIVSVEMIDEVDLCG